MVRILNIIDYVWKRLYRLNSLPFVIKNISLSEHGFRAQDFDFVYLYQLLWEINVIYHMKFRLNGLFLSFNLIMF